MYIFPLCLLTWLVLVLRTHPATANVFKQFCGSGWPEVLPGVAVFVSLVHLGKSPQKTFGRERALPTQKY